MVWPIFKRLDHFKTVQVCNWSVVWTYVILYFDPRIFCFSSVVNPILNFTKQNPLKYLSIHFVYIYPYFFSVKFNINVANFLLYSTSFYFTGDSS